MNRSYDIYLILVSGNEHFYDYFFESSPIKAISEVLILVHDPAAVNVTNLSGLHCYPAGLLLV